MPNSFPNAPLLLGRYRPAAFIARGGNASVYRARDEQLGRDVAIKVFSAGSSLDVERYRDEARVLASLSHHGIVFMIDAGIDGSAPSDPRPFLVMELVRGTTVEVTIAERELSVREIGELGYEVAEVLEYVHAQGVIHRDITPANIMLVDYGTASSRPRAMLTDFGIAVDVSAVEAGVLAETGEPTVVGTAAYLSPEQVAHEALGQSSDIYTLGLVLLECFTRSRAFPGEPVESALLRLSRDPEIPKSIPKPWRALLKGMTARRPADRPTAAELSEAIRKALRG